MVDTRLRQQTGRRALPPVCSAAWSKIFCSAIAQDKSGFPIQIRPGRSEFVRRACGQADSRFPYDASGGLLASNENWRTDQESEIIETGLPPGDNREAAILSTLVPGAYSVVIQGATGGSGVALFEIFALNYLTTDERNFRTLREINQRRFLEEKGATGFDGNRSHFCFLCDP